MGIVRVLEARHRYRPRFHSRVVQPPISAVGPAFLRYEGASPPAATRSTKTHVAHRRMKMRVCVSPLLDGYGGCVLSPLNPAAYIHTVHMWLVIKSSTAQYFNQHTYHCLLAASFFVLLATTSRSGWYVSAHALHHWQADGVRCGNTNSRHGTVVWSLFTHLHLKYSPSCSKWLLCRAPIFYCFSHCASQRGSGDRQAGVCG
jgi:hypothetical protein